jgi:hypothetical protein
MKKCSEIAEQNFYDNIENMEGIVIYKYTYAYTFTYCKCKEGHYCYPITAHIQQGGGMCDGQSPEQSEQNFKDEMKRRGYTIKGKYSYSHVSVLSNCGTHDFMATPANVRVGCDYCDKCFPKGSIHHNKIKHALILLGFDEMDIIEEFRFPNSRRRYDFRIGNIFIEADDQQHFCANNIFTSTPAALIKSQEIDKDKMNVILDMGYKIIRFDYKNINVTVKQYANCIKKAIKVLEESNKKIWLSRPDLYSWLELPAKDIVYPKELPNKSKEIVMPKAEHRKKRIVVI